MASIPGFRFDITGASGSQGLLAPKSGWRVYVFPRGAYASQDSTGTLITLDSTSASGRFAANNWIQVGLSTANIRQVAAVGGGSLSVSGAAVTVTENDRVFLIGNTQPTVTGGSATYTTPNTLIYQRDDDASDLYTNSMLTTNSNGLVQGFCGPNFYDCIIQDGDRSNQGSVIDMPVGAVEGISTSMASVFGATVTINGAFGLTGWAFFGQTVTMHANLGVTGSATFGQTITVVGVSGNYRHTGHVQFGNSVTIHGALGVTGAVVFGATLTTGPLRGTSARFSNDLTCRRFLPYVGTSLGTAGVSLGTSWGNAATVSVNTGSNDTVGKIIVVPNGSGIGAQATVTVTFPGGAYGGAIPLAFVARESVQAPLAGQWITATRSTTAYAWAFSDTPVAGNSYGLNYLIVGTSDPSA